MSHWLVLWISLSIAEWPVRWTKLKTGPWLDEIADWDALVSLLCLHFYPMILGYCTVVLQTPDHVCYFLNNLYLLMLPGAGHCLALSRLPYLNTFAMLLACAPSSACRWYMQMVMSSLEDFLLRQEPSNCLPSLSSFACGGKEGHTHY